MEPSLIASEAGKEVDSTTSLPGRLCQNLSAGPPHHLAPSIVFCTGLPAWWAAWESEAAVLDRKEARARCVGAAEVPG